MIVAIFVFAPLGRPSGTGCSSRGSSASRSSPGCPSRSSRRSAATAASAGRGRSCGPGMQLQQLTTREPDLDQLAVAIAAWRPCWPSRRPASRPPRTWSGSRSSRDRVARRADRVALRRARSARSSIPRSSATAAATPRPAASTASSSRPRSWPTSGGARATTPRAPQELLDEAADDPEVRELLTTARERLAELEEELRLAMVERDPNDDKDVIVEVQGGAGGEEAGLWAGDLYRMLSRYAERRGFRPSRSSWATASTRSPSRATGPTRCSSTRAAPTACSASRRPSRRAASTRRPRPSRCCPRPRTSTSTSTPTTCRSTSTARPGRAGSRSTRPTRRCASRTSRPGSSSRCRTRRASCRTARRRCACCARGCTSARWPSSRRRAAADRRAQVGHGRSRGEDPHLQLRRAPGHRPPRQAHDAQPRPGARGRARRVHRRAAGRREAPRARGPGGAESV